MKKTNLIGENDKTINQDSTSMNEELREWLKETKEEIKDRIKSTADEMSIPPEKQGKLGTGRINAYRALTDPE